MLFNSLNTLQSLIRESPPKALDYTQELSQVLRYTLRDNDRQSVTLAEEMQFARAYIYLMKMRYEENLVFRIAIDERMNGLLLPPMSVQLLIENAIKHNEISNRNPLTITIARSRRRCLSATPSSPRGWPRPVRASAWTTWPSATGCCGRTRSASRPIRARSASAFRCINPNPKKRHESTDY